MSSLKVALFSDSAPPLVNGVATSVCLLSLALQELGHEVTLFAPRSGLPSCLEWPWAPNLCLAAPRMSSAALESFDVVHVHTPFGAGLCGLKAGRRQGLPVVASFHTAYGRVGASYRPLRSGLAGRALAWHARRFYDSCDRVIVPSRAAEGWLRELRVSTRSLRVPTAVPLRDMVSGGDSLLCLARLADEKNVDLVIRAFKLARTDLRLVIVGDGPLRKKLEQLAEGCNSIEFKGELTGLALSAEYENAKAVVLASVCETQGLAVMEAAGYGKPALVCQGSGAAEFVEDGVTGRVVRPEVVELRDAIQGLSSSESLAEWGYAAREKVAAWTPTDMARLVADTYRAVIRQNRASNAPTRNRNLQIR